MDAFDVGVIGSGPGGYVAAVRAAQLGARVALVEEAEIGGTCLNWGCIPTKTLLMGVKFLRGLEAGREFGVRGEATLDWPTLVKKKDRVVTRLRKGVESLFRNHSVAVFAGQGRLTGRGVIEVRRDGGSSGSVAARQIILATGSHPVGLPGIEIDGERVLDSKHALALETPPGSLLIIGAGAIGCEFAHLFSSVGTRVIMVEVLEGLLPLIEDKDVSTTLRQVFRKRGIELHLGMRVVSVEERDGCVSVALENGTVLEVEKVLISIGRRPRVQDVGLEAVGIEARARGIEVGEDLKTRVDGFWAIGDVTGKLALAHVASAQGVIAAENALGGARQMAYDVIPNCVFTEPEVATVGFTEAVAEREGREVSVGRFPWVASGRAQASGETVGFVKVLVEAGSKRILGAQIVGPEATNLVAELALAMRLGVPAERVVETVHAHPTHAEAVAEAVGAALGHAIHI